ncbi:hypothetical protein HPB51_027247 [Rhipicephalus microplus]|uniref:CCHC-type domain-containing protein n=1 Tax=Rhipicephalus microplus TaxID=6941 RepID=A0A9J6D135_RHIMP|nr:hypothetical protein HPB51_027247 [Rhipicephalus microplus]
MPLLPQNDFKIVIRPRGGLDVATTGTVRLASAIYRTANVPAHEAGEDTVCSNNHQNTIVVSLRHASHADKYRQLQAITIGDRHHEDSAYETTPDNTVKGIIKGIPLEEDAKSIHTSIIHARSPYALPAKRLSYTTTVIVAVEGLRVPTYVNYGGALLRCTLYRKQIDMCHCCGRLGHCMDVCPKPKDKVCRGCDAPNPGPNHQCSTHCKLCGGAHMTADRNCRARYKTPYIVTKRHWERRRANEEAEATATNYSTSKPHSRSRTPSRSDSRSRSRTPEPRKQQQRRARSLTPGRTPTRDAKTTDSVSFADAVKGKRATNAEAGGKIHTKIEAEIAQLTQTIQTMQKQIVCMQAQIHAKDELIQKLQSAAHSETDQQAMQKTQEELVEDGEVEGPDTKRWPAISLKKSVRSKRTRAATDDTRVKALETRVSSLEETITATITRTIQ